MKIGFYPKLARVGMQKNKRMYLPYILTCVEMVMMTYIVAFVRFSPIIRNLKGGETLQYFMEMGIFVIAFFATLFLFYTNSFLIKRRKKEFGLYNILGMGKKNISRILLWESVYIMFLSLLIGLSVGILFSKIVELIFVNLMKGEITYSMSIPVNAVLWTIVLFLGIFFLIFLNSLRQVWVSSAISLLRSENTGEKAPKANWLIGTLGILLLCVAYYIALSIEEPLDAISAFFIAVIMVIVATYMIMISASVMICRFLQRKKDYYYKANHFVSVSSMVYRMKRNGAGLASICILATMVLVIIASTSALFIGGEDVIRGKYPREMNLQVREEDTAVVNEEEVKLVADTVDAVLNEKGAEKKNVIQYHYVEVFGFWTGKELHFDQETFDGLDMQNLSNVHQVYLVSIEEYNHLTGGKIELGSDEILLYTPRTKLESKTFQFTGLKEYHIKGTAKEIFSNQVVGVDIFPHFLLVVPDMEEATEGLVDRAGNDLTQKKWIYNFDTSLEEEENIALQDELNEKFAGLKNPVLVESREYNRQDFYSLYGGLFCLGIILSVVFVFAAVLIIYYKQISEGYEDQSRFEIMQKIGMTKKMIRKSINSQLLTVFFLPLLGAGLHLIFAFPIIEKLLLLFMLNNHRLFVITTLSSFLIFALFYTIAYRLTSNAYYKIVRT